MMLTDYAGEKAETGSLVQTITSELHEGMLAVFRCQYASKQSWSNLNQIKVILTLTTSDLMGSLIHFNIPSYS